MNYSVLHFINEEKSTDTIERLKTSNVEKFTLDGKKVPHIYSPFYKISTTNTVQTPSKNMSSRRFKLISLTALPQAIYSCSYALSAFDASVTTHQSLTLCLLNHGTLHTKSYPYSYHTVTCGCEERNKQVCAAEMAVGYAALCASRKVHT